MSLKVFIRGKRSPVTLTKNDFVTQGGEASIYVRQGLVFKVHLDRKRVTSDAKIRELTELDRDEIVRPMDVIVDQNDVPLGFTMRQVQDSIALCKLFTTDFWRRNGVTVDDMSVLVDRMRDVTSFIHSRDGYLIVDGNEFNYLVAPDGQRLTAPYFIDVDSYQTPSFPATAIMQTVRDWHTKGFNSGSDWFAFAIVAFQLFAGIHPYKGRHPDFGKGDLDARMKANVSVFHRDVTLPGPARNVSSIPANYRGWFESVFERGSRVEPPAKAGKAEAIEVKATVVGDMSGFEIKEIFRAKADILYYRMAGSTEIIKLSDGTVLIDRKEIQGIRDVEVVLSPKSRIPIFISCRDSFLKIDLDHVSNPLGAVPIAAKDFMTVGDRVYTKSGDKVFEVSILEPTPGRIVPGITSFMDVLPNATTFYAGAFHMDILGIHHLVMPEPATGGIPGRFHIVSMRELDGQRIIDARRIDTVLAVTSHKDGRYARHIFRFDKDFKIHDVRPFQDVHPAGTNMAVLENGIFLSVNPDGVLEVSRATPDPRDPRSFVGFDQGCRLFSFGTKAVLAKGKTLYSFSMKK